MQKFLFICFFTIISSFSLFSCGLNDILGEDSSVITETKMAKALQEALVLGSKTAANNLGDSSCPLEDVSKGECLKGYLGNKLVEIAVPDTVNDVLKRINSFTGAINSLSPSAQTILTATIPELGSLFSLGKYGDSIKVALNRGAEKAAPGAVDVFKNSIFGMSFNDARGLLMGDSVAATTYLNKTTYSNLQVAFAPIIKEPLDLLNPNKFWKPLASNYNSVATKYSSYASQLKSGSSNGLMNNALGSSSLPDLPYEALPADISQALAEYATGEALTGLFKMVGKQETSLRADPWGTISSVGGFITDSVGDLLGDVFSRAKNNAL